MHDTQVAAPPARNPHCEPQWPRNYGIHPLVANLHEAHYAASIIADLLLADRNIAAELADVDDPTGLPQPFTPNTAAGLRAALNVCLSEIGTIAERLEKFEVRHV